MIKAATTSKHKKQDAGKVFDDRLQFLHKEAHKQNPPSSRRGEARKALAQLRRGLTDPDALPAAEVVYAWRLADDIVSGDQLTPYLHAASLFGLYVQGHTHLGLPAFDSRVQGRYQSLGTSAQLLRIKLKNGAESLDRRFNALIDSRPDDLFVRLRHLFRLLHSHDVPVNFRNLLNDLQWWQDPRRLRDVRRRWAEDYWRPIKPANDQDD